MKDKNLFQDYEIFRKESFDYHSNSQSKYADKLIYYSELYHQDRIQRCHYCGSQKNFYTPYECRLCAIKRIQKEKYITREEAEIYVDSLNDHQYRLYLKTLEQYPTIAAIIKYAEENNCMRKQVYDIVQEMKQKNIWVEKPTIKKETESMIGDLVNKMKMKYDPDKFIESKVV